MFNAPQVQDKERRDDATVVYPPGRTRDCVCGRSFSEKQQKSHRLKCDAWLARHTDGTDYVGCKICGKLGYSLKSHVVKEHALDKLTYERVYGPLVCDESRRRYSETSNYDWINRAKAAGDDISAWKEKLSLAISNGIMSSPAAIQARRENLSNLNKTDDYRKRSSDTAKKTSARQDIQQRRACTLKKWREENPEVFYSACVARMITSYQSVPEKKLFELVSELYPNQFKRGQQIRRIGKFTSVKSGTRQIDILDTRNKIVIEFDGPRHFVNLTKKDTLEHIRIKDQELNKVLVDEGFTVIRVSCDTFTYKSGGKFDESCVKLICEAIEKKYRKLILIGEKYLECNHVD